MADTRCVPIDARGNLGGSHCFPADRRVMSGCAPHQHPAYILMFCCERRIAVMSDAELQIERAYDTH